MANKNDTPQAETQVVELPPTCEFSVPKKTGKTKLVVVSPKTATRKEVTESQEVLYTQDEAMAQAVRIAGGKGYNKISLQNEDSENYYFLGYNR